jgi:hypothetical protein
MQWYTRDGLRLPVYNDDGSINLEPLRVVEGLLSDVKYKRVAETTLADGKWVSTVWLGLDHRFLGEGPPVIFETMVFSAKGNGDGLHQERYSTEKEAVEGHARMVEKWKQQAKT